MGPFSVHVESSEDEGELLGDLASVKLSGESGSGRNSEEPTESVSSDFMHLNMPRKRRIGILVYIYSLY